MRAVVVNANFYPVHPPKQVLTNVFLTNLHRKNWFGSHRVQIGNYRFSIPALFIAAPLGSIWANQHMTQIKINRISRKEIESFRIEYLESLPRFQDIFLEFSIKKSFCYLLQVRNETIGYAIVSPESVLIELHIFDKYMAIPNINPITEISNKLKIKSIYCKSFDFSLLNYCIMLNLTYKIIGYLYRDFIEPHNLSSMLLSDRYANKTDLSFLKSQDDEVFEPKELIEIQIKNKEIIIFQKESEKIGCGFLTRIHPQFDYYDIGVWVHPEHRRKGYSTQIMLHLKKMCLDNNKKPISGCSVKNTASRNMQSKIGFVSKHKLIEFEINKNYSQQKL